MGSKPNIPCRKQPRSNLKILELAAIEGESLVEQALESLLELGGPIGFLDVQMVVEKWKAAPPPAAQLRIETVDLRSYDELLVGKEAM